MDQLRTIIYLTPIHINIICVSKYSPHNSCPIIYSKTGESADKLTATRQNPTPLTQRRTQVKENQVLMIVI
jgi:hypothetical protein